MRDFLPGCVNLFLEQPREEYCWHPTMQKKHKSHRVIQGVLERSLLGWMTKSSQYFSGSERRCTSNMTFQEREIFLGVFVAVFMMPLWAP